MSARNYEVFESSGVPIKAWVRGVPFDDRAVSQLANIAALPFVHKWVAAMPDVHVGKGATVGSVIATKKAVIPAAVGVDIGCGMLAVRTSLRAVDLPDHLGHVRAAIERAVPHGRSSNRGRDKGAWGTSPKPIESAWAALEPGFERICLKHPKIAKANTHVHLGTLGTGNHFIELCLDEADQVWLMLHSGSRGVGNQIGTYFIELAKQEMQRWFINLPDRDLAYLSEGSRHFDDYFEAVGWAQDFARKNRELMLEAIVRALANQPGIPPFRLEESAVNCHHNYVSRENHFDEDVIVTRKGAVSAKDGELGIIPGSMGARSYIVRGKGNLESFHSCSHGAGRVMSRTEAKKKFSVEDHVRATQGIECRKDADVVDETPMAYKPIDAVMAAQQDLVEVVHTLRQLVCVKG
ncbi:MAG TPA: RtcB family protein [Polyangiaceae bacterium]|jgi:tRNA-splicing ligase RtcB|nr:RtcB family protein [Polyangiaceae bacterium]